MQYFILTTVLVTLGSFTTLVSASPRADGLVLDTAKWKIPIKGVNVTLYGTLSEVTAQAKNIDPDWVSHVPSSTSAKLSARQEAGLLCCPVAGQPWQPQYVPYVLDAANLLLDYTGLLVMQPHRCILAMDGPDNAGVVLCSDMNEVKEVWGTSVGAYAQEVVLCDPPNDYVCGQAFDASGYNVIVTNAY